MSQPRLTLGRASLLMVGLGTGALMGVPGFGIDSAPLGPIEGIVRADRGALLEGVELVLFDDASLSPLEITKSDAHGRFAFGQEPELFHVFACLPSANPNSLVGNWALDRERSISSAIEIQLYMGHWIELEALDEDGSFLSGAEVRVLDASYETPRVVQRLLTDQNGYSRFLAPQNAHIGLFARGQRPAHWLTDLDLSDTSRKIVVTLPAGRAIHGTLDASAGASVDSILVSAWDQDLETWRGWTSTDPDGRFSLTLPERATLLRIVDPRGALLPLEVELQPSEFQNAHWTLEAGERRMVQTEASGDPVLARVWAWSEPTQAWGWGTLTDQQGAAQALVAPEHSLVAIPLNPDLGRQEAWGLEMDGSLLQLHDSGSEGR